ncbi:AbrB/MazE/SpoVT family DNA-binding domain-containing protein [Desulfofalx alkaliphila]|uniref:AbrB/MazE/SpoVT family DNA-binding domain-containing protein n=1 Tax=Desulfofalx alkaliphila TaxID=105483 RepID=UPI0004E177B6|nr:AbrB/MazE/SpoVT family DNA-binding domain-containing protein [Desulfofalx alkaliphila]
MQEKTSKLTSKGQTTIPKYVREKLNLKEGDRLVYIPYEDGFLIKKVEDNCKYVPCPCCKGTGLRKVKKGE